jgi:hypothetical protein
LQYTTPPKERRQRLQVGVNLVFYLDTLAFSLIMKVKKVFVSDMSPLPRFEFAGLPKIRQAGVCFSLW